MTLPEIILWRELRKRPGDFKFRRQFPIENLNMDFACLETRLCVEVDGEAHSRGDQPAYDMQRDKRLGVLGFHTLRFPAQVVLRDLDSALTAIVTLCRERGPLHHPASPDGPPPRSGEDFGEPPA